jgi:hypothetical protein
VHRFMVAPNSWAQATRRTAPFRNQKRDSEESHGFLAALVGWRGLGSSWDDLERCTGDEVVECRRDEEWEKGLIDRDRRAEGGRRESPVAFLLL